MFDQDRWKEIMHVLARNKVRSLLTAFGVFWGIFMLVVMSGAGNGLGNGISQGVARFATNSAVLWSNQTSEPYKGYKRGRYWNMDSEDVKIIRNRIPEVDILSPKIFGSGNNSGPNTIRENRNGSFNIKGDYPEYVKIDPVTVVTGRWINEIDISEKRKVCVIGTKVQETMFESGEEPLGEYLKISGIYYQVVGVIRPETRITINGRTEESVFIPFTTMQQTFNLGNQVHVLAFTAMPGIPVSQVEEKIRSLIQKRHTISPTDVQAIQGVNIEKQFLMFQGLFTGITILTWIVGIGTLLAGVIGVSNIMLVIVRERTREIGIQRALGARPATIISQVMLESVLLTTVAGYTGLSLGVGLLELVNKIIENRPPSSEEVFFRNPEISLPVALVALAVLIIAGLFAGSIPAKRAIQIKPIEALREE